VSTISVTKVVAEALIDGETAVRVTGVVAEVITARITPSPTTPTGAGVTRVAAEVLIDGVPRACVAAVVVEVLLSDATAAPGPGGGAPTVTTHTYGYAV
jgi:hypothetical protein